jgi:hypothetical protein
MVTLSVFITFLTVAFVRQQKKRKALRFHANNGYPDVSQYHAIRTLTTL